MSRWRPDAEGRLREAAVALFVERGYDAVTVSDIAGRAGLTRRSFFRYFPDKREVLFAGSSRLVEELQHRLGAASPDESVHDAVLRILTEAGTALVQDRSRQQERRRIIASSLELQERDRTKIAQIGSTIARVLARREMPLEDAELLGAIYADVFRSAYERALSSHERYAFDTHLTESLRIVESFLKVPNAERPKQGGADR